MLAHYRAGRQGDASQAYQDARRTLLAELGIEPGPALKQLHGAIIRQEVDVPTAFPRSLAAGDDQLGEVVAAILGGRLVPVLGEDAEALAARLAERFHYPRGEPPEVPRVSQYAAAMRGYGPLYDELRDVVRWPPTRSGAQILRDAAAAAAPGGRTTPAHRHDVVRAELEQAFAAFGEEVDVVSYIASGRDRGKFRHIAPDGVAHVIDVPNTYAAELSLERRTVILKIRGQVGPPSEGADSFVVTEDDYIDYLGRADVASAVPVGLAATLRRSHFLFLGYTVRDWHLRLVLGRMWGTRRLVLGSAPAPRACGARVVAPPRCRSLRITARVVHRGARGRRGRARRLGGVTPTDAPALAAPFRGLAPFGDTELDALLFFGRERETEIAVANLLASRLTILYGRTGVGKSRSCRRESRAACTSWEAGGQSAAARTARRSSSPPGPTIRWRPSQRRSPTR